MTTISATPVGFAPDEITTSESTLFARLKWVVIVDNTLPAGRQVNAAVCVAAATSVLVSGLLGPDGQDADGVDHPGLPWAGCSILGASAEQMSTIREKATDAAGVHVTDMPAAAQETRVYDEYLEQLSQTPVGALRPFAISLVGPRKDVDKLVKKLSLLP